MIDAPLRLGLQRATVLKAHQRGAFEGPFGHILYTVAVEWGKVPKFDASSQVLITVDGDQPLRSRQLYAEVIVTVDCSEYFQGTPP